MRSGRGGCIDAGNKGVDLKATTSCLECARKWTFHADRLMTIVPQRTFQQKENACVGVFRKPLMFPSQYQSERIGWLIKKQLLSHEEFPERCRWVLGSVPKCGEPRLLSLRVLCPPDDRRR
jgi:hypothetical protein